MALRLDLQARRAALEEANAALAGYDAFSEKFSATVDPVRGLVSACKNIDKNLK